MEGHSLDVFVAPDSPNGPALVRLTVMAEASLGRVEFTGVLLRAGRRPIVVTDDDIALPAIGWELRTSGLWADHICETPLDHWSYGLEAFGLAVDDAAELLVTGMGERTPLGWELEFEARATSAFVDDSDYRQLGIGHGLLLDASGRHEIDGMAVRCHWWGSEVPLPVVVGAVPAETPPDAEVFTPSPGGAWHHELWGLGTRSSFTPSSTMSVSSA